MISIDQNSNSLWDTLPKLQALEAANIDFIHCVEDIDAAFTRVGAHSDQLQLTLEKYYPSGNLDWGASLFYMSFLGRTPLNLTSLTQYTGKTPAQTARQLGLSLDTLYDRFSTADNWQLTAPSYINSDKTAHRLLGDLSTEEVLPFIKELFDKAEANLLHTFPEAEPQKRLQNWFKVERRKVTALAASHHTLADLYKAWLQSYFTQKRIIKSSDHHVLADQSARFLKRIIQNYRQFIRLYNESIDESGAELSPINPATGELPFFAIYEKEGHLVRSVITFDGKNLTAGELSHPVELFFDHVKAVSGKALLLVIIARLDSQGMPLALPVNGSLYTPASLILAEKIQQQFFSSKLHPIKRVKFNFLDQLKHSKVLIRLPAYLQEFLPESMQADLLARKLPQLIAECRQTLKQLRSDRETVFAGWYPELSAEIEELKARKNQYGRDPEKRHLCQALWHEIKTAEQRFHHSCYQRLIHTVHTTEIGYWDSRGALLPWSIALGGETFYNHLINSARIYTETQV